MQPRGTRQRLDHVDAMRPIKQTAVISTHALIYFAPLSTSLVASGMLTLTHFSRDAFLFVSACMLAYSYRESPRVDLAHYWKRRFMAVGLVYLVWSRHLLSGGGPQELGVVSLLRLPLSAHLQPDRDCTTSCSRSPLATTTSTSCSCSSSSTCCFPGLLVLHRHPRLRISRLVAALAWQVVFPMVIRRGWLGFVVTSKVETRLVFSYPLYLIGGVVAAFYLERFHDWVVRHRSGPYRDRRRSEWFRSCSTTARHGVRCRSARARGNPFAAAVIPYDVGAIILVYLFGVYLVSPKRSARTRAVVASGSEAAYGIYVSQVVWILWFQRWGQQFNLLHSVPWIVTTLCAVVFTYLVGWLFSALVARTPLARAVVGRSQQPWHTLFWWRHHVDPEQHHDFGEGPLNLTDG